MIHFTIPSDHTDLSAMPTRGVDKNYWSQRDPKKAPTEFPAGPHPVGLTGKRGDRYFYRGRQWNGPSCLIGASEARQAEWFANRK